MCDKNQNIPCICTAGWWIRTVKNQDTPCICIIVLAVLISNFLISLNLHKIFIAFYTSRYARRKSFGSARNSS